MQAPSVATTLEAKELNEVRALNCMERTFNFLAIAVIKASAWSQIISNNYDKEPASTTNREGKRKIKHREVMSSHEATIIPDMIDDDNTSLKNTLGLLDKTE